MQMNTIATDLARSSNLTPPLATSLQRTNLLKSVWPRL